MNCSTPPVRKPRQAVLIVCHPDGYIEAYADQNVDVHIAQMPKMGTTAGRIAAEQYLDASLKPRYRDLYWPYKKRAADMVREVHPSDIAERNWRLDMLNVLDRIGAEPDTESDGGKQIWVA